MPGGGGPSTPRGGVSGIAKKSRASSSNDTWERWWALNREPYLRVDLPARNPTLTGLRDAATDAPFRGVVTVEDIQTLVAPTLMTAMRAEDPIILDSAAIALGRALPAEELSTDEAAGAVDMLRYRLSSPYPSVRQSALLSLGMLRHRASVPILWNVMNDTVQGRRTLGQSSEVQSMDRSFAAIALGYIGDKSHVSMLLRLIEDDSDIELAGAAVIALGQFGALPQDAIVSLLEAFSNDRIDTRVRAQIPICFGRIGEDAVVAVPKLLNAAKNSKLSNDIRRSAVIALGQLAGKSDAEVHLALRTIARKEKDSLLRHLSYISLSRVGARIGAQASAGVVRSIATFLAREIGDPSHRVDRPWIAIAAGVMGNALRTGDPALDTLTNGVRSWQKRSSNPSDQSAASIALGLLHDQRSGDDVLSAYRKTRDPATRAYLATSLGLMRHEGARDELAESLLDERDPGLRIAAATALAQIGDESTADRLLSAFLSAPTFAEAAAMASALGRIGDRRHLEQIAALIGDANASDTLRGFACVALGMIAEKTALPWNAPLSIDANFVLHHAAQNELLDIF